MSASLFVMKAYCFLAASFGEKFTLWWNDLVLNFQKTFLREKRYNLFLTGLGNTLLIAVFAVLIGVAIGIIVAVVKVEASSNKHSKLKPLNWLFGAYIAVIRGTPVVVQLMIMYYVILASVENTIIVAILAFGINSGAYVAEIIRAGIMAVDKGQMEAGRSLGLTRTQTMIRIILPQAIKNILPALGNEFIAVLKETSVAGMIPVMDLAKAGDIVRSRTYEAFFPLISVAVVYFFIVMLMTYLLKLLERRLSKSDRG